MKGAIIGDVVGSVHEHSGTKTTDFPLLTDRSRFTDDTVADQSDAQDHIVISETYYKG